MALTLMDEQQPSWQTQPEAWLEWERQRLALHAQLADWPGLIQRLQQFPPKLPAATIRWGDTEWAKALLALGRGAEARQRLAKLIWSGAAYSEQELGRWRRLVMQSYLLEGRADDAYMAMVRYRQDYGDTRADNNANSTAESNDEALLLIARILLSNDRATDAVQLLNPTKSDEAAGLKLLAELRTASQTPKQVMIAARRLLRIKTLSPATRQLLRAVVAEAAQKRGDYAALIGALEQIQTDYQQWPPGKLLFRFSADALWQAYHDYARTIGNHEQLLLGNDNVWFEIASEGDVKPSVRSRAIYALLAFEALNHEDRLTAHQLFSDQMMKQEQGTAIMRQLYLNTRYFPQISDIPEQIRRVLTNEAIDEADLLLAAALMQGLAPPAEVDDQFMWQLRQARVFLLAADYEAAVAQLTRLLEKLGNSSDGQVDKSHLDRLMQLLFDLQTVGEHDAAFELFQRFLHLTDDSQLQRELYYWMADSRLAQSRYLEAGKLYLRSAMLPDLQAMDPWAQTARYQAARALAKGGLKEDARSLYQQLLALTTDPQRRAVLLRDVEQLWLQTEELHIDGLQTEGLQTGGLQN